ncbi:hypothetical protein [Mycolicibacterium sp. S3B2]|uniref:hypothetical protein n=1 Tax=Mycolicibacterium sp. S3B2 TaxID=3415120 RepID=UPI003C7BB014
MTDAIYKWTTEVNNSKDEAGSLVHDINDLHHRLDDLVRTIRDLGVARFDDVEDYEVREKARGLWDLVSKGVGDIRRTIQSAGNEVYDLRRSVEFYDH